MLRAVALGMLGGLDGQVVDGNMDYPDNRGKFRGVAPWEVGAATPKFDNPKKYDGVVRQTPAIRSGIPRDAFRVASAPKPPDEIIVSPAPLEESVPDADSWDL